MGTRSRAHIAVSVVALIDLGLVLIYYFAIEHELQTLVEFLNEEVVHFTFNHSTFDLLVRLPLFVM